MGGAQGGQNHRPLFTPSHTAPIEHFVLLRHFSHSKKYCLRLTISSMSFPSSVQPRYHYVALRSSFNKHFKNIRIR